MPSRRTFLAASGAVAGASLLPYSSSALAMETNLSSLPPSIAALKSMQDQARPISTPERMARQEKARGLMESNELDAILLMEGTSLKYFTGIRWGGGERLFAIRPA